MNRPDPQDMEAVSAGTLTAAQATAEFGLSRSELFALMNEGSLVWLPYGDKGERLITRLSLQVYVARLLGDYRTSGAVAKKATARRAGTTQRRA